MASGSDRNKNNLSLEDIKEEKLKQLQEEEDEINKKQLENERKIQELLNENGNFLKRKGEINVERREIEYRFNERAPRIINEVLEIGCLNVMDLPIDILSAITRKYGEMVKRMVWECSENSSPSEFAEILNNLPNLTDLFFDGAEKIFESHDNESVMKVNGNLEKLTKIYITARDNEVFKFFTAFLVPDSIIDCTMDMPLENQITREVFFNFLKSQMKIQKLELYDVDQIFYKSGFVFPSKLVELKFLRIVYSGLSTEIDNKFLKFISRFSELEVLELETIDWNKRLKWNLIGNLINLKEISIKSTWQKWDEGYTNFRGFKSFKSEIVEKLEVPGDFSGDFYEETSQNFPNLKDLKLWDPTQKLNFIAKIFPNLDKLTLEFRNALLHIEHDTGISNRNLKELKLSAEAYGFENKNCFKQVLDVFEIFPDIEVFDFSDPSYGIELSKPFIVKLNSLEKLKVLKLSFIVISNFLDIVEEFKALAQKLERIEIKFINSDEEGNLESFMKIGKGIYKLEDFELKNLVSGFLLTKI